MFFFLDNFELNVPMTFKRLVLIIETDKLMNFPNSDGEQYLVNISSNESMFFSCNVQTILLLLLRNCTYEQ